MKHCTGNIGWYIAKFVLSVGGILFVYWGFLQENEIECYCGAVERESQRENKTENEREKLRSRCTCRWRGITYPCGCERDIKKNSIGTKDYKSVNEENLDDGKTCNCSGK